MRVNKYLIGGSGLAGIIISAVVFLEGGYVNDPLDPGGETNHGITKQVARDHGYFGSMIDLPKDYAEAIYIETYVNKPSYDLVLQHSPAVAHKLIDAGVNTGPYRSSLWFQRALNSLNRGGIDYSPITADGIIGPATMRAYAALEKKRGAVTACELVIKLVDAQQASHYMSLSNLPQYTVGWVDHRIGNVPLSQCTEYREPR